MIDLGLARIGRLLQHAPPPAWKAIHVAGTNGKGSVCAYLSAMLHARGIPSARFTSPHFVDRWDCVVVDERVVPESVFNTAEQAVLQRDRAEQIAATEFELLTATAFEVFNTTLTSKNGSFGVIECGLGGSLDATTAMRADRAVTVVTRIGLDHQALLGNTAAAIAAHKAGIMRPGVPCIVDPANRDDHAVRDVLEAQAKAVGAPLIYPDPLLLLKGSGSDSGSANAVARLGLEPHQLTNLACAYAAFKIATSQADGQNSKDGRAPTAVDEEPDTEFLASIARQLRWPGRLQTADVGPLLKNDTGSQKEVPVLLDGAHNPQSAGALAAYVNKRLRDEGGSISITWILAASHGKDLDEILRPLLREGDRVAAVTFGSVDGMPWVKPASPESILTRATELGVNAETDQHSAQPKGSSDVVHDPSSLVSALRWATTDGSENPIVIAGSLYLVSDTLRLLRQAGGETGLP